MSTWVVAMAHDIMSNALADVQETVGPGLPRGTMILRDPKDPEAYIVATNEPDEVAEAAVRAMYDRRRS